jgi:Tol biopolymer transport system component
MAYLMSEPKTQEGEMKKSIWISAIILLLLSSLGSLALQNGYDQFQKALAKERGEGNLEEAIALYQTVINETKDEALAAQAQLRIGICYEKLGQEKAKFAQEAFQKVVDKYPAQTETVKTAREKLMLLLSAQSTVEQGAKGLSMRSLLTGEKAELAQVSPDGRMVAYFNYGEGSMAVHDLTTGKTRLLNSRPEKGEPAGECWSFRWSSDGDALVCSWWQRPVGRWADLRIVYLNGSEPRILVRGDFEDVYVFDWSPDGSHILAGFYGRDTFMALVSTTDGSLRSLKAFPRQFGNMGFSPDGRFIAYDFQGESNRRRDISVFALDKGLDTLLVTHPAHDSFLGWSPEGKHVLFLSDRTGTFDLWALSMKDGKATGDPMLLKSGVGDIVSAGVGRNGSLFYIASKQLLDVYTAELDRLSGEIQGPPQKIAFSKEGNNSWPQYSPDGRMIVCENGSGSMRGESDNALYVRTLETGEERIFPLKTRAVFPRWTPDCRSIYFSVDRGDVIRRLELATGQVIDVQTEQTAGKDGRNYIFDVSPDGRSFYYVHSKARGTGEELSQLFKRDIQSGQETELYRMNGRLPFVVSLSPDGQWLAVVSRKEQRAIQILPASGGQARDLYSFEHSGGHPTCHDWTPDGRSIIFSKKNDGPGWGLWRVSVDGGAPRSLGISTPYIEEVCVHPDGKRLVFGTSNGAGPELWVMENFLPADEAKDKGRNR